MTAVDHNPPSLKSFPILRILVQNTPPVLVIIWEILHSARCCVTQSNN